MMTTIYSREYGEEIAYYPDDLSESDTCFGCGCDTGRAYWLIFEGDKLVCVEED